ncbi:MAG: hypothetical protein Q4B68_06085 [Bacteroidales bacterium]|nr:hypothetical protein [Bacteroidales bacterium]
MTKQLDEYVEFLMTTYQYRMEEAETRRWEVEYQITKHCNPILMKAGTSGTMKFKSVLQRQEIERLGNNRSQLMNIIKRRRGTYGNTQWNIDYFVSNQGNVYITAINCYNSTYEIKNSENRLLINESQLRSIIREAIRRLLRA